MKLTTNTTADSSRSSSARSRHARQHADVERFVAMIDAELRANADASHTPDDQVEVILEYGRGTIESAVLPQVGDLLKLDQLADEPLNLVVAGRPIARGELVVADGRLGLRILEVLTLLMLSWLVGGATAAADEPMRQPISTTLFDRESPSEIFETPFGSVRGLPSNNSESPSPASARAQRRSSSQPAAIGQSDFPKIMEGPLPESTRLSPRSANGPRDANRPPGNAAANWSGTVWPLLIVVGLIVVGGHWLKSRASTSLRGLPNEAFEVLGRRAIDARTSVLFVRCGSRLLVISASPQGLRTLSEFTDPVEADCLAGLCRMAPRDQPLKDTFRLMLRQRPAAKPASAPDGSPSATGSLDERLAARLLTARSTSVDSVPEVRS